MALENSVLQISNLESRGPTELIPIKKYPTPAIENFV